MDLEEAIAAELRRVIDQRGWTLAYAAGVLDTSVKHLGQVLGGKAHPSVKTLINWSVRLGLTWKVQATDLLEDPTQPS